MGIFSNFNQFDENKFKTLQAEHSIKLEKELRSVMILNIFKEYALHLKTTDAYSASMEVLTKAVEEFKQSNPNYVDDSVYAKVLESCEHIIWTSTSTKNKIKRMICSTLKNAKGMENYRIYFDDSNVDFDFGNYEDPTGEVNADSTSPSTGTENGDVMLSGYYKELKDKFKCCSDLWFKLDM